MEYIPDYTEQYSDYMAREEARIRKQPEEEAPRCQVCGYKLGQHCYLIDGQLMCQDCMELNYMVKTADIVDVLV